MCLILLFLKVTLTILTWLKLISCVLYFRIMETMDMTQLTDYIPEDIDQLNDIPEMDISQMISQNPDPQL